MGNEKTYIIAVDNSDPKNLKILDPAFGGTLDELCASGDDFKLQFIDPENIENPNLTVIANRFIGDCRKPKRPFGVELSETKDFIERLLKILNVRFKYDDAFCAFDVLAPNRRYFKVNIPKELVGQELYYEFLALGPDDLKSSKLSHLTKEYILPSFYIFLYKENLFDQDGVNDLANYQIGLS